MTDIFILFYYVWQTESRKANQMSQLETILIELNWQKVGFLVDYSVLLLNKRQIRLMFVLWSIEFIFVLKLFTLFFWIIAIEASFDLFRPTHEHYDLFLGKFELSMLLLCQFSSLHYLFLVEVEFILLFVCFTKTCQTYHFQEGSR